MSENVNKNQILDQIVALQNSIESIDNILFKIQCVSDSQSYAEQEDGAPIPLDYLPDVAMEKVKAIREIVIEREKTINKMLDFYLKLYRDDEAMRIDMIKSAFDKITDAINAADIESAEKYDAICTVTDKISDLIHDVLVTD